MYSSQCYVNLTSEEVTDNTRSNRGLSDLPVTGTSLSFAETSVLAILALYLMPLEYLQSPKFFCLVMLSGFKFSWFLMPTAQEESVEAPGNHK